MRLTEFLELLTQLVFLFITLSAWWNVVQQRSRVRLDIALVFTSMTIPLVMPSLAGKDGTLSPWQTIVSLVALIAHPYLLLRLVEHFRPLSKRVRLTALAGFVLTLVAGIPWTPDLTTPALILLLLYFGGVESFAAYALLREARAARGVRRARLQLAGVGTVFLTITIVTITLRALIPQLPRLFEIGALLLAVSSALSFMLGFASPRWLRRTWQLRELDRLLRAVSTARERPGVEPFLHFLCTYTANALGNNLIVAASWDESRQALTVCATTEPALQGQTLPHEEGATGRAWQGGQALIARGQEARALWEGALSGRAAELLLIAPIRSDEARFGLLLAFMPRIPLFVQDDLDLLTLFAEQGAVILQLNAISHELQSVVETLSDTNQALREEMMERARAEEALKQAHAELEARVRERTKELEKAVRDLRRATEELSRSNADLEQFAYVASHDLQEPLRAISGCVQVLQRRYGGQLDERAEMLIQHSVDGAARMQRLINDLLAYSRLGTRGHDFAPVDLDEVLNVVLRNLAAAVAESGAVVTRDALPEIEGDRTQLEQLFQNLLSNAIKFRGNTPPRIHVGVEWVEGTQRFYVRDNGIGIDTEYLDRIFVIFQRLHTRNEYPGTGIGLALCKKIVERHGGRLWAEPAPDEGTIFYFTLPERTYHDLLRSPRASDRDPAD